MTDANEWLTVPQASALIGVSERTLYRLLKSDNNAARTLTEQRQTATGRRQTTLVPRDLADELRGLHGNAAPESRAEGDTDNDAANAAKNGNNDATSTPANTDTDTVHGGASEVSPGTMPVGVYQHRIADLEAQNADLRADKARLYDLLQLAQENLKREQSLRLLTVEHTEPLEAAGQDDRTGQDTQENGEMGVLPGARVETPREAAPKAPGRPGEGKRSWWARLWSRG